MVSYHFCNLHNLSNFMQDSQNIPSNQFNYDNQIQIENNYNLDNNIKIRGINNEIKINKNQSINGNYFYNVDNRLFIIMIIILIIPQLFLM